MEEKICNFLFTLFQNKDFISQEIPILADVENIISQEMSIVVDLIEKKPIFTFLIKPGVKKIQLSREFLRLIINSTLRTSVDRFIKLLL